MNIKDKIYSYDGVITKPRISFKLSGSFEFKNLFNKKTYEHWHKHFPRGGLSHRLKFSMKDSDGVEQICSVNNPYVKFYSGDRVSLICSKETDLILRVINKSKGKVWVEKYGKLKIPKSNFGKKITYHLAFLGSYIKALFRSLPVINFFDMVISAISTKNQRISAPSSAYVMLGVASIFYLTSYIYPLNAPDHIYQGKATTITYHPYNVFAVFDEGPSKLAHLVESGTIVSKSDKLKSYLSLLAFFTGELKPFRDEGRNQAYIDFYNSSNYNHATDYGYVKFTMLLWMLMFSFIGFIFHGAFLTIMKRDQMRKQIALDDFCKQELESTAFMYQKN